MPDFRPESEYKPGERQAIAERPRLNLGDPKSDVLVLDEAAFLGQEKTAEVRKMPVFGGVPSYEALERVLTLAYDQSARGKGSKRHARDKAFSDQPIVAIPELLTGAVGLGGVSYQAIKKVQEACGMVERGEHVPAMQELLGVIVYAAAAYLHVERIDQRERIEKAAD